MRNGAFKHDPMHLGWETVLLEWLLVVTMRCEVGMGNVEKRNRLQTFLREEHRLTDTRCPRRKRSWLLFHLMVNSSEWHVTIYFSIKNFMYIVLCCISLRVRYADPCACVYQIQMLHVRDMLSVFMQSKRFHDITLCVAYIKLCCHSCS